MAKKRQETIAADDMGEFVWAVASAGHRWVRSTAVLEQHQAKMRFLVPNVHPGAPMRLYDPLRAHTGLFKAFADVNTSEDAILEFANKFGVLGGEVGVNVSVELPDGPGLLATGEPLDKWTKEIQLMRSLVLLWEMAGNDDAAGLRKFIVWKNRESVAFNSHPNLRGAARLTGKDVKSFHLIASNDFRPEIFARFQVGDVVVPARCYVQQIVNEKLAEHSVHVRLLWDSAMRIGLRMVPSSLIGCLWLQFARAIEGDKAYHRCQGCQAWFEVGGSRGARADKRFCSPSCKASAHRKKREEALRLGTKQLTIDEIARRLDTDIPTVRRWLKG